jgi:phosphate:Na+ symporter
MPLRNVLLKLAFVIIPEKKEPEQTVLLDELLLQTPGVAVQRAKEVAGEMAEKAQKAMELAAGLVEKFDPEVMQQVIDLENETDHYEDVLGSYLVKLSGKALKEKDNRLLNTILYTLSDLERIGDHALNVAEAAQEMNDKGIVFSKQAQDELAVLQRAVGDIIKRTVNSFVSVNMEEAMTVEPQEQVIDSLVREIKSRHVRRLRDGQCSVEYGFVLEDLLTAFERSADHCSNLAVELLQLVSGKMDAHEYLHALKSGELRESASFAENFAKYQSEYTFPEEQ